MKKLFLTILCLCIIFSGFIFINSGPVYAEKEILSLKFVGIDQKDNEYFTNFKNNVASPYGTCQLNVYIDNTVIGEPNDIVWSYKYNNGSENMISFDGLTTYDEASFEFVQEDDQDGHLNITSFVAGKFEIIATLGGQTSNVILNCKYATYSPISIDADGETELNYEDLTSLVLTANLEYEKFMESGYTFTWYRNAEAEENAEADAKRKEEVELKNKAEQYINSIDQALQEKGEGMEATQKEQTQKLRDELKTALDNNDLETLKSKIGELEKAAEMMAGMQTNDGKTQSGAQGEGTEEGQQTAEDVVDADSKMKN